MRRSDTLDIGSVAPTPTTRGHTKNIESCWNFCCKLGTIVVTFESSGRELGMYF